MAFVTVNVPDEKLGFFIELVESLGFMSSVEASSNFDDLNTITQGLAEVKRIQSGELPKNKIEDLLSDISFK
jgi:hypothetical protein